MSRRTPSAPESRPSACRGGALGAAGQMSTLPHPLSVRATPAALSTRAASHVATVLGAAA